MTTNSPLLTDLYEITMAHAAWHRQQHEARVCFHLFFRKNPFAGGFAVAAGADDILTFLERLRFSEEEILYLEGLAGADEKPLFHKGFLEMLRSFRFTCDVDAVPEGTPVFFPMNRCCGSRVLGGRRNWWRPRCSTRSISKP
jgi:nicotinate phosphoribosyltransferase